MGRPRHRRERRRPHRQCLGRRGQEPRGVPREPGSRRARDAGCDRHRARLLRQDDPRLCGSRPPRQPQGRREGQDRSRRQAPQLPPRRRTLQPGTDGARDRGGEHDHVGCHRALRRTSRTVSTGRRRRLAPWPATPGRRVLQQRERQRLLRRERRRRHRRRDPGAGRRRDRRQAPHPHGRPGLSEERPAPGRWVLQQQERRLHVLRIDRMGHTGHPRTWGEPTVVRMVDPRQHPP